MLAAILSVRSDGGGKVSEPWGNEQTGVSARDSLLHWAQRVTSGYPGVNVKNFTTSWRDGLAFNAILHRYRPDLVNWREVRNRMNARQRLEHAFRIAENEFGVTKLLDPEDVDVPVPDEKSLITYISSLYDALPEYFGTTNYENDISEYTSAARDFLQWMQRTIQNLQDRSVPFSGPEIKRLQAEMELFKNEDLPSKLKEKQRLERVYRELYELFAETDFFDIDDELSSENLDRCWKMLLNVLNEREIAMTNASAQEVTMQKLIDQLHQAVGVLNERLDVILQQIEDVSARGNAMNSADLQRTINDIVEQLNELEVPIENLFQDVETLKTARHPQASEYYKQFGKGLVKGLKIN
ncbi:unnamed protein product [Soboliphyme baturini]|uniref:Calponin-homology (CH) domain-containing protein n=1 Tax=Soboliphyme baturini TaxID=241478 RepID=A0A183ILC1_9BILA|nr:unnamed protein product [Soboliphyme baturini]